MSDEQAATPDVAEEAALELILAGGDAREAGFSALKAARGGDFATAHNHLAQAREALKQGHEIQTRLLQGEAGGARMVPTLLLVHAHGHLMTAQAQVEMIEELLEVYRRLPAVAK